MDDDEALRVWGRAMQERHGFLVFVLEGDVASPFMEFTSTPLDGERRLAQAVLDPGFVDGYESFAGVGASSEGLRRFQLGFLRQLRVDVDAAIADVEEGLGGGDRG